MAELSPMMKQYFDVKSRNKDAILFFRLGDFYEMFYDDAKQRQRSLSLRSRVRNAARRSALPCAAFHTTAMNHMLRAL